MDRRADLHAADLFRLLWLQRHGHRLALLFGISLPANFNSPFKARNVIDYWSRWHITLTRFLTAYLYNPIVLRVTRARMAAGKPQRARKMTRHLPRAGRLPDSIHHVHLRHLARRRLAIRGVRPAAWLLHRGRPWLARWKVRRGWKLVWWHQALAVLVTFQCVVVAMVFFRAADVPAALAVLKGMLGLSPDSVHMDRSDFAYIAALLAFVWGMPNVQQWMGHFRTALNYQPSFIGLNGCCQSAPGVHRQSTAWR